MLKHENDEIGASRLAEEENTRRPPEAILPLSGTIFLSACGGGGGGAAQSGSNSAAPIPPAAESSEEASAGSLMEDRQAARSILHASLSASEDDILSVRSHGLGPWLDEQMTISSSMSSKDFFHSRRLDEVDDARNFQKESIFDPMIWAALIAGKAPVRARMAFALSQIFVVSITKLPIMWPSQAVGHYWDLLNEHAFGNFRDLLEAVCLNPAMGAFLDTIGNSAADKTSGRMPDENFSRELMQLFTIGLFQLNPDGSQRLNGGRPIPTYTNDDVQGLAKVFTGYQLDFAGQSFHPPPGGIGRQVPPVNVVRRPLTSSRSRWAASAPNTEHSRDPKSFLGLNIPAGTGPEESLAMALDHLSQHPNVAPFFAKRLIQRLVTSNPSHAYVERVASIFVDNGQGIRGDLGAVFKAVITDQDATAADGLDDSTFGALREPVLRFTQWARTFKASSESGSWQIRDLSPSSLLNQAPFRAPSVFNFYSPDYSPAATQAGARGLNIPEFQIADEVSVAGYVNFIRRSNEGTGYWTEDIFANFSNEVELSENPIELIDHLDLLLSSGQLKEQTRQTILRSIDQINSSNSSNYRINRVMAAILLIMVSNDYLIQK